MNLRENKCNIYLDNVIDFNIEQTLECGQCFHFEKLDEMEYAVIAYGKLLHIKQTENTLVFINETKENVEDIWIPFFDLKRDYGVIKKALIQSDNILSEAIEEKYGVRIMNQEFYEMVISFIISQNKQIPHIKQIVFSLSEKYGKKVGEINGKEYYAFPELEIFKDISEEEFRSLKTGFRAPYLVDASRRLTTNITKESMEGLDYDKAKEKLMEIKGIGEKVANCVLLFGLSYRNAFPIDVWIKRTVEVMYFNGEDVSKEKIVKFAKETYGQYGGYAQQYLFYFGRSKKIKK